MAEQYLNYIDGKWLPAQSGAVFSSTNPANRSEELGSFPKSGAADVDQAVAAAKEAYPSWSRTPVPERADFVLRVGLILEQRKEELSR